MKNGTLILGALVVALALVSFRGRCLQPPDPTGHILQFGILFGSYGNPACMLKFPLLRRPSFTESHS